MKDIKDYFSDLRNNSKKKSTELNELTMKRINIDDTFIANKKLRIKKKLGRAKIKISPKSEVNTIDMIVNSSSDLIDMSIYQLKFNKKKTALNNDVFNKNKIFKISPEINVKDNICQFDTNSDDQNKNNAHLEIKNELNYSTETSNNAPLYNKDLINQKETKRVKNKLRTRLINNKNQVNKAKILSKLKNNKKQLKRKMVEDISKIENRLEKRKKESTIGSNIKLEITKSDEYNDKKNNLFKNSKPVGNLLTYFSKTNSEEFEKQSLMKTKVTIKANIHESQNSSNSINTIFDIAKEDLSITKCISNLKQPKDEFDEIHLIEPEMLVISPKNDNSTSYMQPKQKWSLKIQLQSNNKQMSGKMDNNDTCAPIKQLKLKTKYIKNSKKIPKILLPKKNKKEEILLSNHVNKNKKKDIKNLKIEDKKNVNIQKRNAISNKSNHCSTIKQCDTNILHSKQPDIYFEYQIINKNCFEQESKIVTPVFKKKIQPYSQTITSNSLAFQTDVYKNNTNFKKLMPIGPIMLPFPKIGHITQFPLENHMSSLTYNFILKSKEHLNQFYDLSQIKSVLKLNNERHTSEIVYKCVKSDIKASLLEIKSYCSEAQALCESIFELATKYKNSESASKITNFRKLNKYDVENKSFNCLWIDKYKPNSSLDIVGNEEAAAKLKSWLNSWKSLEQGECYSSSEEFCTFDKTVKNYAENNQVAVLIGPYGSGKTASVYAIANELDYKVLEINASSKRPGKKILKDFEEATKSHRVESINLKSIFTINSKEIEETKEISQNSLILMEDIDLVFEEDEGFISATFQLASNTKRPIIMTLTSNCSYLSKIAPLQLQINYQPVTGKRLLALFQLIMLLETGCKLPENCINILCRSGDLRKGLLQLQYLLLSGKENITFTSLAVDNTFLKDMQILIYKSAIRIEKNRKKRQISNNKSFNNNVLDNLINCLEIFALISILINIDNPISDFLDLKFEPSISLIENQHFYSNLDNMSLEISNWLSKTIKKIFLNNLKKSNSQTNTSSYQFFIKKRVNKIDKALSQIASVTLDRQAIAVDYLSNIRTICRAEEIRNQFNNKRCNRFFHYLQNFKFIIDIVKSSDILSAACKILQETSTVPNLNE